MQAWVIAEGILMAVGILAALALLIAFPAQVILLVLLGGACWAAFMVMRAFDRSMRRAEHWVVGKIWRR